MEILTVTFKVLTAKEGGIKYLRLLSKFPLAVIRVYRSFYVMDRKDRTTFIFMKQIILQVVWGMCFLNSPTVYAQDHLTTFIDSLLLKEIKPNQPGGAILVARGNSIIYEKAFGMVDAKAGILMTDDMPFYIGSNTKQFTAVSILQLFELGKLSLQDALGKFISAPPPINTISLQQLLAQTSGLGDNIDSPMRFASGTQWEYNNENYQLLGKVIEKVSGLAYADYLDRYIFRPAGMFHSSLDKGSKAYAAGGIQSTPGDMFKWNQALKSGKLLKPRTLQLAFTPQPLQDGKTTTYGFGWRLGELQESFLLWHGGLFPGYSSETFYLPREDVYLVMYIHSDTSMFPIIPLSRIIAAMVIGRPYNFTEIPIDKNVLQLYTGVFEDHSGLLVNISTDNGQLFFQRPYGQKYPMTYGGDQEFFLNKDFLMIKFLKDSSGEIHRMMFSKVGISLSEWTKTTRPLLKLAPNPIPANTLKQYAGRYILNAHDTLAINTKGPNLILHMSGQTAILLIPQTDKLFYNLKDDTRIEFLQRTDSLILYKGQTKKSLPKARAM